MKKLNLLLTFFLTVLFAGVSFSQGTVTGKVVDATYNESLIGATVVLKGTTTGTVTDINGAFSLKLAAGSYTIDISYIGYELQSFPVTIGDNETHNLGKVKLASTTFALEGVNIMADRAKERQTPVALSNISKAEIQQQLGSQDLPMIMNMTPGVYATQQGGGAGDARINVRGFNQRNVAIMINGVPVNDMENGWVYWSNWDGIADATSSIQMQRGLSAINLATPSVGGTMNIITSPAEMEAGASGKFEYGSGNFMKTTISAHTGLINNKFAASVVAVRKVGEGVIDKTWTDAWAYYMGLSYQVSKNHRLEAYIMGAPQKHGQNLYKQNVAMYNAEYAKEVGADSAVAYYANKLDTPVSPNGRLYNENWNSVNSSYSGDQYFNGKTHSRYDNAFINERENYFHKPLANLNWYAQWGDKVTSFTTVYWSGGKGGGSGTYGKIQYDYDSEPTRIVDWDATIEKNQDPTYAKPGNQGAIRNSVNNQSTIGALTKVKINFSETFKGQIGLDWRTAKIEHFRELRDMLGLTTYTDVDKYNDYKPYSDFWVGDEVNRKLGDKVNYFNTNTVDWFGGYLQGEYTNGSLSAYGTAGYSMIKYSYVNHFKTAKMINDSTPDLNSGELKSNTDWIAGYQFKGGLNYNFNESFSGFVNFGYVSKVPIFDEVINDGNGIVAKDPQNEKFISYEAGVIYNSFDNKLDVKGNFYYTTWKDRIVTKWIQLTQDEDGFAFIKGLDQRHMGLELEANYRIAKIIGVGGVASIGNWKYLNDVNAQIQNEGGVILDTVNVYAKDLKVGDAPQSQVALWANIYPVKGLNFQLIWRYNANHYADFNPVDRDDESDRVQSWKTPSYSVFDMHINYSVPLKGRVGLDVFAHMFNLLDTFYVQDALDNSPYNGYKGADKQFNHDANRAEVFLGMPRTFNVGVKISFH
ncbi:MAG: TonB-dependent receptor [Bacteroidetes bacterium CG18_big_fil_WC_8_21_14_2_50_41_14]|nr:MAG: TonB-dependent receptor [Bacteroidetes bacterium CG18_big_fil_WC_8_21_14_2_50_41_14]